MPSKRVGDFPTIKAFCQSLPAGSSLEHIREEAKKAGYKAFVSDWWKNFLPKLVSGYVHPETGAVWVEKTGDGVAGYWRRKKAFQKPRAKSAKAADPHKELKALDSLDEAVEELVRKKEAKASPKAPEVTVLVVCGVEGPSLYVNGLRVAGPKPWGGGHVLHTFRCVEEDLFEAVGRKKSNGPRRD